MLATLGARVRLVGGVGRDPEAGHVRQMLADLRIDANEAIDVILVGSTVLDKELQLVEPPTPVLQNKEMILVPKGNPAKVHGLKDLANPGVKLSMGTPTSAVGRLAGTVVQNAAADYGFDFVSNLRKNIVVQSEKGSDVVDSSTSAPSRAHIASRARSRSSSASARRIANCGCRKHS